MHHYQEVHMRQCLALAEKALQAGNPPVGAIIVWQERVIGAGQFPSFEIRKVVPPTILALGYIPVFNINYALTIGTLAIRTPLEASTVNVTGTVVLAAGDQVALFYNNDGMSLPVQIFYSSFAIKKL